MLMQVVCLRHERVNTVLVCYCETSIIVSAASALQVVCLRHERVNTVLVCCCETSIIVSAAPVRLNTVLVCCCETSIIECSQCLKGMKGLIQYWCVVVRPL